MSWRNTQPHTGKQFQRCPRCHFIILRYQLQGSSACARNSALGRKTQNHIYIRLKTEDMIRYILNWIFFIFKVVACLGSLIYDFRLSKVMPKKYIYPVPSHKPKTQMLKASLGQSSARPAKGLKYSFTACSSEVFSFACAFHTVRLKNTIHDPICFLPQSQTRRIVVLPCNIIKNREVLGRF